MPLPDIKDYWSSEWNTQMNIFGDVISRVRLLQILWMMHVGNDTTNETNRAIKRTKKLHGVIEYRGTVSEIFFTSCPCCTNFSSKTDRLVSLRGFKNP
jgi:hypothetical protein